MNLQLVTVYLGLGSNMGERQDNLEKALELLGQRMRLGAISSVYDTAPVGNVNQPCFLNMACQVYTGIAPLALLTLVKGIELKLGRLPGKPNSPRPIDIDILFYDKKVMETPELIIPHPRLAERAFVLVPLVEIAPELVHPVLGKTASELLKEVAGVEGVWRWGKISQE